MYSQSQRLLTSSLHYEGYVALKSMTFIPQFHKDHLISSEVNIRA